MRAFYFIRICEHGKWIANNNAHMKFLHDFTSQPCNNILAKIDMPAGKLPKSRQKLLRFSPFWPKYFLHAVKVVMNKRTCRDHLLSLRRSFAVTRNFVWHGLYYTGVTIYEHPPLLSQKIDSGVCAGTPPPALSLPPLVSCRAPVRFPVA